MKPIPKSEILVLQLWWVLHRTHDLVKICEDRLFPNYGLTTEQYAILITVAYGYSTPVDIARWLARSPHSISMLIDRAVKAGLVRRSRDRVARRIVRVSITSKGQEALRLAHVAGWRLVRQILEPLSDDDKQIFLDLLLKIRRRAIQSVESKDGCARILAAEGTKDVDLYGWLIQHASTRTGKAKHPGAAKEKSRYSRT